MPAPPPPLLLTSHVSGRKVQPRSSSALEISPRSVRSSGSVIACA